LPSDGVASPKLERVLRLAATLGLELDDWQRDLLEGSMLERPDGKWAAFESLVVVPRQNGKNAIIEVRQLAGLFVLNERLQVHSAHEFKTALEHFIRIKSLVECSDDLMRRVKIIRTGSADMSIELKGGARLRFVARSKSSGRGLTGDTVYLDEAFALTAAQLGALIPTMRARRNGQVWYTSSAPKADSDQLHALLKRVERENEPRLFAALWENPAGTDVHDREAWWRVNPAMGVRIAEESMENEFRLLSATDDGLAEFMRECLGIREMPLTHSSKVEIAATAWRRQADPGHVVDSGGVLAVDVAPEAVSAALVAADESHVGVITAALGTRWVIGALEANIVAGKPRAVGVDPGGPAQQLVPELRVLCKQHDVKLVELPTRALAAACGEFVDAVKDGRLFHLGQPWLDDAVASGRRRAYGDAWLWDRRVGADISSLIAVTVARRVLAEVPAAASSEPMFAFS
jgi:hypothetical protein